MFLAYPYSEGRVWMGPKQELADRSMLRSQVRFAFGMAQMAGAAVSLVLLLTTGVTTASLVAVVLTSLATTMSVLLFGSRRARGRSGGNS